MADWYLDLVGGNDANNGTSFAQRMKTFTALDAKAIAAGDTIRVMKSRDPSSLGVNMTTTDGSSAVTLSAAVTKRVALASAAWTAGANCTTATGTVVAKVSAASSKVTIGAAYVNGAICAYFDLGASTDFSAYQQLNFWMNATSTTPAGTWEVRLCSDAFGVTAVNTFSVPAHNSASHPQPVVIDLGSAMSASVRSIAIYKVSGTGTPFLEFNNFFASTAPSASDCLTLYHQIGKNSDPGTPTTGVKEWYPIQSVDGTAVVLSCSNYSVFSSSYTPSITSETVPAYAREFLMLGDGTVGQTSTKGGSASATTTYQGGYDTTNMSAVTGDTCFGTVGAASTVWIFSGSYTSVNNLHTMQGNMGINSSAGNLTITDCSFTCTRSNILNLNTGGNVKLVRTWVQGSNLTSPISIAVGNAYLSKCRFAGGMSSPLVSVTVSGAVFESCFVSSGYSGVAGLQSTGTTTTGSALIIARNSVFRRNSSDITISSNGGDITLDNCLSDSSTEVTISAIAGNGASVRSTNHDQTANNHQQWHEGGKIISDSTTRHTASGIAWKFSPTSTARNSAYPLRTKIATVYCVSGVQTTVSAYFAKDHANISIGLRIIGGQLGGPAADTTQLSTCATTSTYESTATQIQWTPTSTGWVEIEAICYTSSSTTSNGWVDDFNCVYG